MKECKIKTCGNCQYFTGIQCHGHGEYWGNCCKTKKAKNDYYFMCYEDTPCLLDIKTMRTLYFKYREEAENLKINKIENDTYKLRYESKCRTIKKYQDMYYLALEYLDPKRKQEFSKKIIEFLKEYKIPDIKIPKL